jgi:transposase
MGLVVTDDGWRIPDPVWALMEPLLPARPSHPLGCHNPLVSDRDAMNAILLVLRTGMQWNALDATGICGCASAHRRFREWRDAGCSWSSGGRAVGLRRQLWDRVGVAGDGRRARQGAARWRADRPESQRQGEEGAKRSLRTEGKGVPLGIAPAGANLKRPQARPRHARIDPDRAAQADAGGSAGALPRRRLRQPGDPRARAGVRVHRPHPRTPRGGGSDQARGRLPRPPLGRRAHPLLAQQFPPHPHPLGETRRHLPRDAPPRLRPDHPARRQPGAPTAIGA